MNPPKISDRVRRSSTKLIVPYPGKLPHLCDTSLYGCRVHVFLSLTGHEYRESQRGKRVGMWVKRCVCGGTCQGLHGGSGTTCSLGDFCAIRKIIILANDLICSYRGQICLRSAIQNEPVSLLSYLSLYFQDYAVGWGSFDIFSLQTIWKDVVFCSRSSDASCFAYLSGCYFFFTLWHY